MTGDADRGRRNGLATAFPTVPHVIIPNSGHMMNMENPVGFNAAVMRFTMTGRTGKIDAVTPCIEVGQSTGAP
ncbi:MAG: hypothetical protein DI606_20025 [Sphingobium sp.]|nr:MAG: hypothetical protein DI606_20025 [Sphingobium sp.]